MLNKLIKYEFKATGRTILPLYLAVIVVTFINKLLLTFTSDTFAFGIPRVLSILLYVFIIIAMFVITYLIMIQRFYKNLMKDEGYLMFTLPVNPSALIASKLIVSVVWNLLSIIVSLISVFILAFEKGIIGNISEAFSNLTQTIDVLGIGTSATLLLIEAIVYILVALVSSILMIYCAISIGQLFNGHKVVGAFASYIGIYMVIQLINTVALTVFGAGFDITITTPQQLMSFLQTLLTAVLIIDTLLASVYYFTSHYLLKNKLNLE